MAQPDAALARAGFHVVVPDQRGYSPGARSTDDADYTIDHMVADTIAIADHFHAKKFDLVGHDWGAGVAWATAIAHPDRLKTLTAVSVPHAAAYAKASEDPNGEQHNTMRYYGTADCCLGPDAADFTKHYVDAPFAYRLREGVSHWIPEADSVQLVAYLRDMFASY